MWTPKAIVAVLLALSISSVLLVHELLPILVPEFAPSEERLSAWSNVIHFMLGGVVALIAHPVLGNGQDKDKD